MEPKNIFLLIGAIFGGFAVILGAFGAHYFKKLISKERLESFETDVKYQMYHAIVLLIVGVALPLNTSSQIWACRCFVIGTILFSGSIYFLSFADYWKKNLKFLGPITPLGGLFLIIGWGSLVAYFL
ncbi:DUF423 domain-containing protein [Rhizosphaericola mali]|uniref:DUF423 domain-containing protein n=1 Tax=Rhizosphaericola mali TaxID=2545455 RepID=A0A5P2G7P7_9BACT|nr:DUF423 domain-containing protein [Rhizosphaericola mali]QES89952.1 DUF423 domain-containing protein [Rhizosphaericola mali]